MDKEEELSLLQQIEAYYIKGRKDMERICARMGLRDSYDKEDCIQTAFCNALAGYKSHPPRDGKVRKWLNAILHNAVRDFQQIKRRDGMSTTPIDMVPDEQLMLYSDPEDEALSHEELERVMTAMNRLDVVKHRVCYDFLITGNSVKEVASYTNVSPSNVRKIVQRFRESLGERRVFMGS